MASMSSMISLIVMLLATYAYSVPVVSDMQNETSTIQVENATVDFRLENVVILARRDTSDVAEEKHGNDTVGLSSSSSEDESDRIVQTTDRLSARNFEDTSLPSSSETNTKHGMDTHSSESFHRNNNEQSFTEDSLSTEVNTERGIEVESFESSTVDDTSVAPSSQVKIAKRSSGSGSWLAEGGSWPSIQSNGEAARMKRSSGDGSWLAEGGSWPSIQSNGEAARMKRSSDMELSTDEVETSTVEDTSVPSTNEVTNTERDMDQSSSFTGEKSEDFDRRVYMRRLPKKMGGNKRGMDDSLSLTTEGTTEFNRRAIGSVESGELSTIIAATIESESSTDEQQSSSSSSSSAKIIDSEVSSTSDYETTEGSVEHFTSSSPVPTASTAKILAIIPGKISRTQLLVDPATGTTAGFRPAKQVRLTQGQNQTLFEERKPNY